MNQDSSDPIRIDWSIVETRMDAMGLATMGALLEQVDVSRSSLFEAKRTGQCSKKTFDAIMTGLDLHEDKLRRMPMRGELPERVNERVPPNGWTIETIGHSILVAANEVSYQVAKLRSEHISHPARYARGKFYDALYAPPVSHREYKERLTRHAAVCSRLPRGTRVPQHIDIRVLGEESAYWVLDEWIPSTTLSSLIDNGVEFCESHIKLMGAQMLETLSILHSHQCVVRELSPERILIEDISSDCYITDFEMAQMLDSEISVSGKWRWTPAYRAPEVGNNDTHWQSDLYSWAIIMVELFSGNPKRDEKWIQANTPTPAIAKLLNQCLDNRYHHRPSSIDQVMKVWQKWSTKS